MRTLYDLPYDTYRLLSAYYRSFATIKHKNRSGEQTRTIPCTVSREKSRKTLADLAENSSFPIKKIASILSKE